MPSVIRVRNLKKTFRSKNENVHAINGIDLDVEQGEILGILGPNGAGKTTFLNTLSTLLLPDSGTIEILGIPYKPENFPAILRQINMSSGYPNYAFCLSIKENLEFYGRLYGLSGEALNKKVAEVMDLFSLEAYVHRRFDELSSGTKQRLSLAKAMLNDPKILFLDEPTIGLDPDVAIQTREIVKDVLKSKQVTVLFTSHNMPEVEEMCQRVAFIRKGNIVKLAAIAELKKLHNTNDLEQVFIHLARENNPTQIKSQQIKESSAFILPVTNRDSFSQWLNRCYAFTTRSAIFAGRNLFVMTDVFFWPMISLISIGLMSKFIHLQNHVMEFIMTGTLAAGVLQIGQLDVGYAILYELWSKSLKHTLLTPVGITEGVLGCLVSGIIRGLITFGIMAMAAVWWFGFELPSFGVTCAFLLGIFGCALILGIFVNILILSFGQKVEITAWMFGHLFLILCGIYYPIDVLPWFFHKLALVVPITHFLEYFRHYYGFSTHYSNSLFIGYGLTVIYLFFSFRLLKYAYIRARKNGVVVRLSE